MLTVAEIDPRPWWQVAKEALAMLGLTPRELYLTGAGLIVTFWCFKYVLGPWARARKPKQEE